MAHPVSTKAKPGHGPTHMPLFHPFCYAGLADTKQWGGGGERRRDGIKSVTGPVSFRSESSVFWRCVKAAAAYLITQGIKVHKICMHR